MEYIPFRKSSKSLERVKLEQKFVENLLERIQSSERNLCINDILVYHLIVFSTLRIHNQTMAFPPTF